MLRCDDDIVLLFSKLFGIESWLFVYIVFLNKLELGVVKIMGLINVFIGFYYYKYCGIRFVFCISCSMCYSIWVID